MNEPEQEEREAPSEDGITEEELEGVSGGAIRAPVPGGPIPVPYPNTTTTE
jgi:hypothetical protein